MTDRAPAAERIAPDLGPRGETDRDLIEAGLEEIADEGLVYVEGEGWLYPEDL